MKFFLALFAFFFIIFTCGMAVLVWKVRKRMRDIRDAMRDSMGDDAFQRMADKNYYRKHRDQGPVFDEEYFKGDPNRTARNQQEREQQQQTRRTTHTSGGVTIIDDRSPDVANKKIFDKDEGEYVDYVEN
ncbi:MAG: DUF4834 family protein [Prevotella sp.]|nr:DUF4834 family protein [Prevotella sp.]